MKTTIRLFTGVLIFSVVMAFLVSCGGIPSDPYEAKEALEAAGFRNISVEENAKNNNGAKFCRVIAHKGSRTLIMMYCYTEADKGLVVSLIEENLDYYIELYDYSFDWGQEDNIVWFGHVNLIDYIR